MNPFRVLWKSVVDVYDNLFPMVGMNLLWLGISIPTVFIVSGALMLVGLPNALAFPLALLFALLGPNPGSVGIHYYATHLVNDERVEFDLYWTGLKSFWRKSLVLLAITFGGEALLGMNLYFYLTNAGQILRFVSIVWLYAIVLWTIMGMYMAPLLIEQEKKGVRLILRNALVLSLDNIFPSLLLLVVLVALSLVSIGITLLVALLTGSFVAVVQTRAVSAYLDKYRTRAANQSP